MIRGVVLFTPRPEVTGAQLAAIFGTEFTPLADDVVVGTVDGCEIRLLRTAAFPVPWPVQLEVTVPSVAAVIDRCRELGVAAHGGDHRVLVEVEGRIDITCVPMRPASEEELNRIEEPMSEQERTEWPAMDVPGWQALYSQLQSDVAELDPYARVSLLEESPYLHLHVERADAAVLQQVREACFSAEGASIRTCATCGEPGQMRPRTTGTQSAACPEHAAMPERESGSSSATPPPSSRQPPGWPAERRGAP